MLSCFSIETSFPYHYLACVISYDNRTIVKQAGNENIEINWHILLPCSFAFRYSWLGLSIIECFLVFTTRDITLRKSPPTAAGVLLIFMFLRVHFINLPLVVTRHPAGCYLICLLKTVLNTYPMWFLLDAYSIYVATTALSTCMLNFIEASLKCSLNLFLYGLEFNLFLHKC